MRGKGTGIMTRRRTGRKRVEKRETESAVEPANAVGPANTAGAANAARAANGVAVALTAVTDVVMRRKKRIVTEGRRTRNCVAAAVTANVTVTEKKRCTIAGVVAGAASAARVTSAAEVSNLVPAGAETVTVMTRKGGTTIEVEGQGKVKGQREFKG